MTAEIKDNLESEIIDIVQSELCDWGCESNLRESANALANSIITQLMAAKRAYINNISSDTFENAYGHKCRYKAEFQYHAKPRYLLHILEFQQDALLQKLNISFGNFKIPMNEKHNCLDKGGLRIQVSVLKSELSKVPEIIEWDFPDEDCWHKTVFIEIQAIGDYEEEDASNNT